MTENIIKPRKPLLNLTKNNKPSKKALINLSKKIKAKPKKKSVNLIRRAPCFLMGGNHFLINHLIDDYLELKDVLELMRTNQSTRKVLINNQTYWYQLWRDKKYGKPQKYNYFHTNKLTYQCLVNNHNYYNNPIPSDVIIPTDLTQEIPHGVLSKILKCDYSGYFTRSVSIWYYNNPFSWNCRYSHWEKRGVYPLKYYGNEFDSNKNYFQMIKQTDRKKHLLERLATKQRIYQRTLDRAINHQQQANWAHRDLKNARDDLDVYQRAYDFYLQEQEQIN